MTHEPPPLIAYALPGCAQPADRLLRRIVAWTAILWAADSLAGTALQVALSRGWVASPPNMSWSGAEGWSLVVRLANDLAACAMLVGGVLLLWRSRVGIVLLRGSAVGTMVLSILSLAVLLRTVPTFASYWSTPAAAAMEVQPTLTYVFVPALVALLTMPPLARRML